MGIKIVDYNIICNLGNDIDEAYKKALSGINDCFEICDDIIKSKKIRLGKINCQLPEIDDENYNLRCNQILLKCFEKLDIKSLINKYGNDRIAVVGATTNTGGQEFEYSNNIEHAKISNPSDFIRKYYNLNNYHTCVSTACSSGIKAFSIGIELLNSNIADAVIVAGTDNISKIPIFGFDSLEILSNSPSIPFSKNRCGMNIAEGAGIFILEKNAKFGIDILGIGETTDSYHATTPDPSAVETIKAIDIALKNALLKPSSIDYINLHGTGTFANDLMEGTAINKIFGTDTPSSSTKPLTGHCLGAAASVEIGLCCKLLESKSDRLFPHIYDNEYDDNNIPKINLVNLNQKLQKSPKNILCTSFGFGGTNTAIVLGAGNETV